MSVQCHACIGGTNVGEDIRKLDYGQHVVSGTPGRVFGKISTLCSPKSSDFSRPVAMLYEGRETTVCNHLLL